MWTRGEEKKLLFIAHQVELFYDYHYCICNPRTNRAHASIEIGPHAFESKDAFHDSNRNISHFHPFKRKCVVTNRHREAKMRRNEMNKKEKKEKRHEPNSSINCRERASGRQDNRLIVANSRMLLS